MKAVSLFLLGVCISAGLQAQCVYISEYTEGSGNNKCIEIYNGTGAILDLAVGGYAINIYANGSGVATSTINLIGMVANGDVFVICNPLAAAGFLAQTDQTSGSINFNGNDAVELVNSGGTLDVVGQIGVDPGTEWVGTICTEGTENGTMVRKPALLCASFNGASAFDPDTEWNCSTENTLTDLGSHTTASCVLDNLTVSLVGCNNGTATVALDFTATNPSSTNFELTVMPDPGGISGTYSYTATTFPMVLGGFNGDNITTYDFQIEDEFDVACLSDQLSGVTFDCPVADELVFTVVPAGCVENSQFFTLEVCAVKSSTGQVQTDYTNVINVIVNAGATGTLFGATSQTAVNGCVTFSLLYTAAEVISFTASDGLLVSSVPANILVANSCPELQITMGILNPCGADSQNELVAATTGAAAVDVGDVVLASIDPTAPVGMQPEVNYTWSSTGTNVAGSTTETCGVVGLQCNQLMDVNNLIDGPIITTLINALNTQAGCGALFVAPTGANLGSIPANSKVVFFLGAGGNPSQPIAPGFDGLGTNIDFTTYCGQGPIYAVFSYHENPNTTFGFFNNNFSRTYRAIVSGTTTSDVTYATPSGSVAAEIVSSSGTYTAGADCTPPDLFGEIVLDVENLQLNVSLLENGKPQLRWEWRDTRIPPVFEVERKTEMDEFFVEGKVLSMEASSDFVWIDEHPILGENIYRLKWNDENGVDYYSQVVDIEYFRGLTAGEAQYHYDAITQQLKVEIQSFSNGPGTLEIISIGGNSVFIRNFDTRKGVNTFQYSMNTFPAGIYICRLQTEGLAKVGKFMKF